MLLHCVHTGDFCSPRSRLTRPRESLQHLKNVCFQGGDMEASLVNYMLINKHVGDEGLNGWNILKCYGMVELRSLLMKFVGNMPQHIDKETIIYQIKIKTHKLKWMHISSYFCQNDNLVYNTCTQDIKVLQLESLNFDFAVHSLLCGCHLKYKLNHIPTELAVLHWWIPR